MCEQKNFVSNAQNAIKTFQLYIQTTIVSGLLVLDTNAKAHVQWIDSDFQSKY